MAIDSAAKRNSALIDNAPVIFPDGSLVLNDWETMLGQYEGEAAVYADEFLINLYLNRSQSFSAYIKRTLSRNGYIKRRFPFSLEK